MDVLVIHCHPDAASFVGAVRERVERGLEAAGHRVTVRDLYAEGFDPTLTADERHHHFEPGVAPDLVDHARDLTSCDALVLVYPTWWSGQPAMLKGWLDRVWARGVAWDLSADGTRLRPLLGNVRRIVAVTTHGSSKLVNALEGEGGKRTLTRSMRSCCHRRCRTTWLAMYDVDRSTAADRERFLDRVERRMGRL